jgi:hypothetical protein
MGDKIYSSAASGYLILPNLTESNYDLRVGFAKSNEQEAKFSVPISQNDKGYIIKKMDDGLALFDFQELSLVKANAGPKDHTVYETKTDNFTNLLSKAADDPSIVRVPVAKKEEAKQKAEKKEVVTVKSEEAKPVERTDTENTINATSETANERKSTPATNIVSNEEKADKVSSNQNVKETAIAQQPPADKEETAVQNVAYKPSAVTRHSESSTTEGFGVVYFDIKDERTDTIRILIPVPKVKLAAEGETSVSSDEQEKHEKVEPLVVEKKKQIENADKKNTPNAFVAGKSNCNSIATEKDFMKLRKKMAAKEYDDAMRDEAKREFRSKCYSVEQIRNLSTLFLTSAAKYQFFDAAYEHVTDKENFASLGTEIKDDYYTKRFKALIGE